jgi:hypothetical protein
MTRPETRNSKSRWRALGSMAMAIAAVAVIGLTSIAPAKADDDDWRYRRAWHDREGREHAWREYRRDEWRERHPYTGFYYSPGYYQYGYDYSR